MNFLILLMGSANFSENLFEQLQQVNSNLSKAEKSDLHFYLSVSKIGTRDEKWVLSIASDEINEEFTIKLTFKRGALKTPGARYILSGKISIEIDNGVQDIFLDAKTLNQLNVLRYRVGT